MRLAALLAAPMLAISSATLADEVIATHGDQAPVAEAAPAPSSAEDARQANGDWARRVLAGQSTVEREQEPAAKACQTHSDGKPHGEVWAGVGTGGYRNVGGVVTQPIGECGSATIAINRTEFDDLRRGRRR